MNLAAAVAERIVVAIVAVSVVDNWLIALALAMIAASVMNVVVAVEAVALALIGYQEAVEEVSGLAAAQTLREALSRR